MQKSPGSILFDRARPFLSCNERNGGASANVMERIGRSPRLGMVQFRGGRQARQGGGLLPLMHKAPSDEGAAFLCLAGVIVLSASAG